MGLYVLFFAAKLVANFLLISYGSCTFSGEIDRCLKKVTEGVETFEDIWQKVFGNFTSQM